MQYYILKKDDNLDKVLNMYGLTYQKFISLNGSNFKDIFKEGNKILINKLNNTRTYNDDIVKIYEEKVEEVDEEIKYIEDNIKEME